MGKQFAVFGLGSFGNSVALTLQSFGCDVIAVDNCYEKIQDIADSVSYAMCGDVTEPEFMKTIGARNLDGAVIAVSENLEAAIMATMISKEMGISYVLVKAMDELQGKILEKVGADSIVYPEIDMGERVAKKLISTEFIDWIELSPDYSLTEKLLPKQWEGKSLAELRVREKYGINVIGILKEDKMDMALDPSKPLQPDDMLFIIGKNSDLEKFKLR